MWWIMYYSVTICDCCMLTWILRLLAYACVLLLAELDGQCLPCCASVTTSCAKYNQYEKTQCTTVPFVLLVQKRQPLSSGKEKSMPEDGPCPHLQGDWKVSFDSWIQGMWRLEGTSGACAVQLLCSKRSQQMMSSPNTSYFKNFLYHAGLVLWTRQPKGLPAIKKSCQKRSLWRCFSDRYRHMFSAPPKLLQSDKKTSTVVPLYPTWTS